ncbi:MAG TPA: hypothetical protein VF300_00935 [Methanothrix sp.]
MKVGVCGIACEVCPRMVKGICPNGEAGCLRKENRMCGIATCAFRKGVDLRQSFIFFSDNNEPCS